MPRHCELALVNLALYQQILRTAERVKTLRREIDDISREVYERLDDLDIMTEAIQSNSSEWPMLRGHIHEGLGHIHEGLSRRHATQARDIPSPQIPTPIRAKG